MTHTKNCEQCGEPFEMKPKIGPQRFAKMKFCSVTCRAAHSAIHERRCLTCGDVMVRKPTENGSQWSRRKYCSHACDEAQRAKLRCVPDPKPCAVCGTKFEIRPTERASKFARRQTCSERCATEKRGYALKQAMPKRDTAQAALEQRCRENIERYWARLGKTVKVDVLTYDADVYVVRSNLVGGVPA